MSVEEQKCLTQDQQIIAYQMRKIAQDFDEKNFAFRVIGKQNLKILRMLFALPMSINFGYAAQQGTIPFLKQMGSYLLPYFGAKLGGSAIENFLDEEVRANKLTKTQAKYLKPWMMGILNVAVSARTPKVQTDQNGQTVQYPSWSGEKKTIENK